MKRILIALALIICVTAGLYTLHASTAPTATTTGSAYSGDVMLITFNYPDITSAAEITVFRTKVPSDFLVLSVYTCFEDDAGNNDNTLNYDVEDDGTTIMDAGADVTVTGTGGDDATGTCEYADVDTDTAARLDKIVDESVLTIEMDADGTAQDLDRVSMLIVGKRSKF